ncbi:MAG: DUF1573 domain-containing protein [Planctomycetaceae bacterium]|nr:DUF1573 domain-containing protein [Planctomycetaceae bacterium]
MNQLSGTKSNVIICEESDHDFGHVSTGKPLVHCFKLKNIGRKPVSILKVAPGCRSCIEIIDYQKTPIQPGMIGDVILALLIENQTGEFKNSAIVKTDASDNAYLLLKLYALIDE